MFHNIKLPLNNDHLSTTATNFGSRGWSLYTSLTVFSKSLFIDPQCTCPPLFENGNVSIILWLYFNFLSIVQQNYLFCKQTREADQKSPIPEHKISRVYLIVQIKSDLSLFDIVSFLFLNFFFQLLFKSLRYSFIFHSTFCFIRVEKLMGKHHFLISDLIT